MDFRDQFFNIITKIDKWVNISVSRYWDWEKMLILWQEVGQWTQAQAQDKRTSKGMTKLWEALSKTLDITCLDFYYAIPCQCCNLDWKLWYMKNLKSSNYTYANLFINNNYQYFRERLKELKREVIVIANWEWQYNKYPFKVKEYHSIPDDCVNYFANDWENFIKKMKKLAKENTNQLFFISAWPLANIAVYEMFNENPNNTYIDMWSAIDERTKGRITRWFQRREDMYAQRYCKF